MTPTREVFFNIRHVWVMYALFAVTLAIFSYGFCRHWQRWSRGLPASRTDRPWQRLQGLLRQTAAHDRLLKRYRAAGFFHLLFFWGMVILTAGTTVVFIHNDLGIHIMQGAFYLYFQSLTLNIFGALFIVALLAALVQRYVARPSRLKPDHWQDGIILILLLTILLTGFILQGARIQLTRDPWGAWSPVGNVAGSLLARLFGVDGLRQLHLFTWWFHMALVFGFIAWIPYSKLMHLLTAPANIYLRDLEPRGALPLLDIEKTEALGISRLEQFSWKDLFDLDACTECGRCEVNCPANISNKPLSPKWLILDLQKASRAEHAAAPTPPPNPEEPSPLVGPVIREETLWSCTTCRACMEQCPVMIEQVPKIVQMRRHLVMERAEFPDDLQGVIRSLEARGHPYPGSSASRSDWHKDLDVHVLSDKPGQSFDVLLWVGCAGAMNDRSKSVTRAVAQLLQAAGVRFAILSREEKCTGDPARRIGHEFLFQQLAQENIATFDRYGVKKILTSCPHCFNTLRNEYPQLGGNYQVIHHSEFLQELVASGRLRPEATALGKVVFHDPCYLGRYNQVYGAPRQLLDSVPNSQRAEVPNWSARNALCCGGGGGFSFMEEKTGTRMSHNRSRQLVSTGADTVAVGCPFCMTMLEDGVKTVSPEGQTPRVLDIAEVLAQAIMQNPAQEPGR
jgi:Fe-S oxidoreductase/nitrate reductase gamma subunit